MQLMMKHSSAAGSNKTLKRRRGRPTKEESIGLPLEDLMVAAAKQVCCEYGVHGLTVEHILRKAGISRPTFYKFFKNKEMVLEVVCEQTYQKLIEAMQKAVLQTPSPCSEGGSVADLVIDTYLAWGMSEGCIVKCFYEAITDETSIVTRYRTKTVEVLQALFQDTIDRSDIPECDPLLLTSMINLIEFLGVPLFSSNPSKAEVKRVRNIMRMVLEKLLLGKDIVPYDD